MTYLPSLNLPTYLLRLNYYLPILGNVGNNAYLHQAYLPNDLSAIGQHLINIKFNDIN
jgi:hypothetical protein